MINAYDFDETIYDGDSSIDFYFFCLKKNKKVLLDIPSQIKGVILYKLKKIDKTAMKEHIFSFLKRMNSVDDLIDEFWNIKIINIKEWYKKQQKSSDVIISASPEFLLKPLEKKLNVKIIASIVDKKTGKFISKNCHDYEKIKRYEEQYPNQKIKNFYSDSISADYPMFHYAQNAYLVKKNEIIKLDKNKIKK